MSYTVKVHLVLLGFNIEKKNRNQVLRDDYQINLTNLILATLGTKITPPV